MGDCRCLQSCGWRRLLKGLVPEDVGWDEFCFPRGMLSPSESWGQVYGVAGTQTGMCRLGEGGTGQGGDLVD